MEGKNLCVLSGTEDFMRGELDNVTVQEGAIVLDNTAGRYALYGCYTSQPISLPEFNALVMSWNASTPEGTVVEAQARVMVDGNWTTWSSFGKWSPYLVTRANAKRPPRGPVEVEENVLRLQDKTAFQAQLRIYLYTDDEKNSPRVWLLAASVHTVTPLPPPPRSRRVHRVLRIPAYSQLLRDPAFGGAISLPVCMAGLMNRWGEDVLPEELAHAMYDWADQSCADMSFAAAAAGSWGYESYAVWTDLDHLRQEVREGFGAAVELRYSPDGVDAPRLPPALAEQNEAKRHFVTVTGFLIEGDRDRVLVNEPLSPEDSCAPRVWDLDYFCSLWTGLTLLLHRGAKAAGWDKPRRTAAVLRPAPERPNLYRLEVRGEPVALPDDFCGTPGVPKGTLAIVKNAGPVFATTAHKRFRFVNVTEGGVLLPAPGPKKFRYSVYAVDGTGRMTVGEVTL